ncbi:hypothetical protein [Luteipulveratus mongoliensis]|uniref:GGDEF domain-containing protein n=1 Tax=Luteipulveratus mongoliensis TaxID=571913 RepID=A0A0K1JL85_9MICO|nr:hypothetical protein [Luteipulveratus mongoliensis]AKU17476.1 hypothetical protein VV02_19220 [Luteipulveratus mongoliensis]
MSGRRRVAWTDQHALILFCAGTATAVAFIAGGQTATIGLGLILIALGALLISLCVDGFIALCVGLCAAAAAVFLFRARGLWGSDHFFTILTTAGAMLVLSWVAGQLGASIRSLARGTHQVRAVPDAAPAVGSLGLLTSSAAMVRLDEEVARAQRGSTPLSLLVITVHITDTTLDEGSRTRLGRSLARLVESLARSSDVPFMVSERTIGAILPETDLAAAWEQVGPIVDAATRSTFADRVTGDRRALSDCAELHAGLVLLDEQHSTGAALLAAAQASADPSSYERSGGR